MNKKIMLGTVFTTMVASTVLLADNVEAAATKKITVGVESNMAEKKLKPGFAQDFYKTGARKNHKIVISANAKIDSVKIYKNNKLIYSAVENAKRTLLSERVTYNEVITDNAKYKVVTVVVTKNSKGKEVKTTKTSTFNVTSFDAKNPTVKVSVSKKSATITLKDDKKLKSVKSSAALLGLPLTGKSKTVKLKNLKPGTYSVTVEDESGRTATQKFTIK